MGQYYHPVLSKDGKTNFTAYRARERGGLKLMEHSWWDVELPNAVAEELYRAPAHLWWMGDYAVDKYRGEDGNYYPLPDTDPILLAAYNAAHGVVASPMVIISTDGFQLNGTVLCNHTRRIFMDCDKYREALIGIGVFAEYSWIVHPLPLLTAVGNGNGGGDYFSESDQESVGTWAGDLISVENEAPEGYTEVTYKFYE